MKCSICNLDNPAGAETCSRCGFSLSLSQIVWPDAPQIEVPRAAERPSGPPAVEPPAHPPPEAPASTPGDPLPAPPVAARAAPTDQVAQTAWEAQMAYEHVVRGFQAIRQERREQARWEFEQARDLAEDSRLLLRNSSSRCEREAQAGCLALQVAGFPFAELLFILLGTHLVVFHFEL